MIYVLMLDGRPIAAAERMERLNEAMAGYDAIQQVQMHIEYLEVLE